jgi:hypothetical protein
MSTNGNIVGLKVKLDRDSDRQRPCCDNVVVIRPTSTMHAGELRCERCSAFRGWASKALIEFLETTRRRFGAPAVLPVWRRTQQENTMAFAQKPNRGSLFRNNEKEGETDRDYSGSLNIEGCGEFWLSGWVRTSQSGGKYLSLSAKRKTASVDKSQPLGEQLHDAVAF